jgi:hypothetical protein
MIDSQRYQIISAISRMNFSTAWFLSTQKAAMQIVATGHLLTAAKEPPQLT